MHGRSSFSRIVAFFAAVSATSMAHANGPAELRIHHLDIEQGDATLIVSPDGHALLFDGGNRGMGTTRIIPRLRSLGVTSLDYTVASHYDADHIAGLAEVINGGFQPIVAYDRGASQKTTDTYAAYVAAAGARRRTILPGEVIRLGAEVVIECVAVNGAMADGQRAPVNDDENASSIALVVRYRGFEEFIAGDLTAGGLGTVDVESLLGPSVRDLDVYRVCHHGSETSTSAAFLARTLPEVALISCGTVNDYGHPAQSALDRLTQAPSVGTIWSMNRGSEATSPKLRVVSTTYGNDGEVTITTSGAGTYSVNEVVYPLVVDATPASITAGPNAETARPAPTILWTTSEPAEAVVEYGLTTSYGAKARRTTLSTAHAVGLPGLAATTTYHYRVGTIDSTGNTAWSQDLTLTTSSVATWRGVVINEVASNSTSSTEWVEIKNGSAASVDMTGWVLTDGEGHDFRFPAFALPVNARVVVTSAGSGTDDTNASDGLALFRAGGSARFATTSVWNDAGDDVCLKDAAGNTVDFLAYGTGTAIQPPPLGEWSGAFLPRPASGSGLGLSRFPEGGTDTASGADWALRALTQGSTNGVPPVPPTAIAGPSLALREGETVMFDGSASSAMVGATITSYVWSFGDGSSASGARVSHTYADDGEFQAVLTITDSNGLSSIAGKAVQVSNVAPTVTLAPTFGAMQGVEVPLTGSATDGAADAPTLSFAWDFGDGSTGAGASIAHIYTAAGTFTATLYATDKDGDRGAATTQVTVVTPSSPHISSVTPAIGSQGGGTRVSIRGYRLGGAVVTFGGQPATVVSVTAAATPTTSQTLECLTPPGVNLGLVDVRVTTSGGRYTRSRIYDYSDPAPTITSISPGAAPTGNATMVTITGAGFFQAGATLPTITVGGRAVQTITKVEPTTITCLFPDDLSGLKDVVVTTPDGRTATLAAAFERRSGPRLEVSTPTNVIAGYPTSLTVRVTDETGTTITSATNPITIGLNANPTGAILGGTLTATPSNGVATFTNLTLDRMGAGLTVRAVSSALSGESTAFAVQGGPAALAFKNQPRTVELGTTIPRQPPITVEVHDAFGRAVVGASVTVTIAVSGGATLSGTTTLATTTGTVTFSDLSIAQPGVDYVLSARVGSANTSSQAFDVLPAPTKRLVFLTSPGNGTSGRPLGSVVVGAQDMAGNSIALTETVTLSVPRTAPQGPLYGTWAMVPATGRSTFSDLQIMAAGGYTLIASAPGYQTTTSAPFSVAPGPASRLAFRGQPTLTEARLAIWPPIRVVAQDSAGNDVAAVATVTISLASNPTGAQLSGSTVAALGTEAASFHRLVVDRVGAGYTLVASANGLVSGTSAPFDIEAALGLRFKVETPVANGRIDGVAIGDLDGDGLGDVVSTLPDEDAITVRRSLGAGRFSPEQRIAVGDDPRSVVIGDLDDDGWPDIAVANTGSREVAVLYGASNGVLSAPRFTRAHRPVGLLVLGDVDGDGRLDLTATSGDSDVLLFCQTSVGTLSAPLAVPMGGPIAHHALADIDRDGALDVVVALADAPSRVAITYGDRRGGYSGTTTLALQSPSEPHPLVATWVGVADLTGDGFPEVVAIHTAPSSPDGGSQLLSFPNRRNRTFGTKLLAAISLKDKSTTLTDVTGDGVADVMLAFSASGRDGLIFLRGKRTGGFAAEVRTNTLGSPVFLTAGDVNGDGLPDLAVTFATARGQPTREAVVALSVGDGTVAMVQKHGNGGGDPRLTTGDITRDGLHELLLAPGAILVGRPVDTYGPFSSINGSGFVLSSPHVGSRLVDFNGDGHADVASAGQNPGRVVVWRGLATATLAGYMVTYPIPGRPQAIEHGDLNGDGRQDLVVTDAAGAVWTLLGRTGVAFDQARSFPCGPAEPSWLALADVTGDGKLDALVVTTAGVQCLPGTGTGGFAAPIDVVSRPDVKAISAGDLDGDGRADLIVITPGSALVLSSTGQGAFQSVGTVALSAAPRESLLRDMDRDGRLDLVVINNADDDVSIFLGQQGRAFAPARRFPTGRSPNGLAIADLNGDGRLDVATANLAGSTTVLLGW